MGLPPARNRRRAREKKWKAPMDRPASGARHRLRVGDVKGKDEGQHAGTSDGAETHAYMPGRG